MKREEIFQYVKEQYGTEPEYLWKKDPDSAVLRHKNGKWYAIIMVVEKKILGLEEDGNIDILDVKCDPDLVGMIIQTYGFLPGYHMNKRHWITILLDESVSEAKTLDFLDMSYDLTESSKSPASIAQSNKQWVGTCLYQEWYKPLLISCEAAIRL